MNSQGSNWLPSMNMPPLGFGVVMPQPTGISHIPVMKNSNGNTPGVSDTQKTWQYQQHLLMQQGLPVQDDGVAKTPLYPQQYFANAQQQQQWMLQQQRVAQGQKLIYEKFKKQQQFNEQKQRLQDFNSCKSKGTCSADIMIQNILSKDENATKHRMEKREPVFPCIESDDKNYNTAYIPAITPNIIVPPTYQQAQLLPQQSLSCLPISSQSYTSKNHKSCNNGQGLPYTPYYNDMSSATVNPVVSVNIDTGIKTNDNVAMTNSNSSSCTIPIRIPLQLPDWLKDCCNMPEVYKKACDLVESSHGWVDTSRAYMLLMKTNVPPHLLGVLWEMVNRNEPGRLQISEFCGLLALVALIQKGQSFVDAEILKTLVTPVYPIIDHPALLALSQAELNKQQYLEPNSITVQPQDTLSVKPVSESFAGDDEFDDFVCAVPSPITINEKESVSPFITTTKLPEISPPIAHPAPLVHKSKASDQERSLNFPSLGNSPLNHNKCSESKETDEFSDFQSAFNPSDELVLSVPASNDAKDKYDVFRDLTKGEVNSNEMRKNSNGKLDNDVEENDESFGDFCCSVPVIVTEISNSTSDKKNSNFNISEDTLRNTVNSKFICQFSNESSKNDGFGIKVENCVINSANKWAKDPFGEFEASFKINSLPNDFSSDSSQYVTANASTETLSDPDDDFGDFVGPSEVTKEIVSNPGIFSANFSDLKSETQSVASLELPGLEMTVNLSADAFKIELPVRSDDHIDFEQQFKSLSFNVPITKDAEKVDCKPTVPVVTPESFQIADKYSIIRAAQHKERCLEEPHIESWKKCLNGCIKLLQDALMILENIKDKKLLAEVLKTSQMQDYLLNLSKVHEVQLRIQLANQNMTTTIEIQELLIKSQDVWNSILAVVGEKFNLKGSSILESKDATDDTTCSLCLQNGGASLVHGGLSYHPPCANLWLNVVDLTLPSLTYTKGSFL